MEVRNIVKEVVSLVYEWEDEDDENENNDEGNEKICDNDKIPERFKDLHLKEGDISCDQNDKLNIVEIDITPTQNGISSSSADILENTNGDNHALDSSSSEVFDDYQTAINLTKRRLHLMETLGFKIISRLDVCSNIVEYAKEIEDNETILSFLQKGSLLAKVLYGPSSDELSKWNLEINKINNLVVPRYKKT